jgi:vesicle coat complex subunit
MDFVSEINSSSASDVISFVKEVLEKFPKLRSNIVDRLTALLGEVRAGKVYRGALWAVGEYADQEKEIREVWKRIRQSLGEIPILSSEQRALVSFCIPSRDEYFHRSRFLSLLSLCSSHPVPPQSSFRLSPVSVPFLTRYQEELQNGDEPIPSEETNGSAKKSTQPKVLSDG